MNRNQEFENMRNEYQKTELPQNGREQMKMMIEKAKFDRARYDKSRIKKQMFKLSFGMVATAACAILILPNTSAGIAMAMEKLPVIGPIVRVVTIREYKFDDGHNNANVEVPIIKEKDNVDTENDAISGVNKTVKEYTDEIIRQFQKEMESTGEGYHGLDLSYETVTDTKDWFTLKITAVETQASGYEFSRYYHIDKMNGKSVVLKDLFVENTDYIKRISDEIKQQMRLQMQTDEGIVYWIDQTDFPDDNFEQISEIEDFYWNEKNELVVVFDEYQVAPGYMGCPEFVIPENVVNEILK